MLLREVEIEAAGASGWFSKQLVFGKRLTQLFGPNGCGKTPVIQSIAFALGYPVRFREDIYKNCEAVILRLSVEDRDVELHRRIDKQFDVQARIGSEEFRTFYDEKDYSKHLFQLFGVQTSTLTSTSNEAVEPYLATYLPIFYLDQDNGYTSLYSSPSTFIRNQYTEMMRLAFGLPPKHSFDKKKIVIQKKRRRDELDRAVVRQRQLIENLTKELSSPRRGSAELEQEIIAARKELEDLKDSRSLKNDADFAINNLISDRQNAYQKVENEIHELSVRVEGFARIKEEIEIEINTLSLNEEARRLFGLFDDICSNQKCGLFLGSAESYGKNLLYLRDQVKDLQRNTVLQQSRIEQLGTQLQGIQVEISGLEKTRQEIYSGEGIEWIIEAIGGLTRRIIDIQKEKQTVDELEREQDSYIKSLNEREAIQNDLASLGGSANASDLRTLEIRRELRHRITFWLDVLRTKNVSREVHIDNDFSVQFGDEKINQLAGSTLLRVILAVRTAVFELYTREKSNKFRFFILDTPRQQDIEAADLGNYVGELKKLAVANDAQVIFSTTEYHYKCAGDDEEWVPEFPGAEQNMFLGAAQDQQSKS